MLYETYSSSSKILTKVNGTYEVKLYIGCRVGYDGITFSEDAIKKALSTFQTLSAVAPPVRITPTLYVDGLYDEGGWELATLAYPGKLYENDVIEDFMFELAKYLIKTFQQKRITVVTPTFTYMFEDTDDGGRR
jgi:hypothetical protein